MIKLFKKNSTKRPNHIALTMDGSFVYASKNKVPIEDVFQKNFQNMIDIIKESIDLDIPILTFNLFPEYLKKSPHFGEFMDFLIVLFTKLVEGEFIHTNQVKVSVFGKWYDLPGRVVDPIKDLVSETRDYDKFFLNFCINYHGQKEIVDACKLLIMQAMAGKLDPDSLDEVSLKETLYTSYFMPPDLIIKTGKAHRLKGFLLWDSVESKIYFADKYWPEFTKSDFEKAIDFYSG